MKLAYSFRRCKINNNISVQQLMVEYPIFFQENEQFDEFERLTAVNIQRVFNQESARYSKSLLQIFLKKQSTLLKSKQEEIENILSISIDDDTVKNDHLKETLGLYVIPLLLYEKVENFVEEVSILLFHFKY